MAEFTNKKNSFKGVGDGIGKFSDFLNSDDIVRLSDIARGGYMLSAKECKMVMGKRANIPCIDEIAENFADDPIVNAVLDESNMTKKPDTIVVF